MDAPKPLVLPVEIRAAERQGAVDIYLPDDLSQPRPVTVIVHGGPLPPGLALTPRDWPAYRGYGSLLAARGVVAVTVDHRLHAPTDLGRRVDGSRTSVQVHG